MSGKSLCRNYRPRLVRVLVGTARFGRGQLLAARRENELPRNFIVGYGVFARAEILPTSLAWDAFALSNGASSLAEMRRRIARYRQHPDDPREDYMIGCRVLTQPVFLAEADWVPVPPSWSRSIQQGRRYDTTDGDGLKLWEAMIAKAKAPLASVETGIRFGEPTLIRPRLGQGAFRISVTGV